MARLVACLEAGGGYEEDDDDDDAGATDLASDDSASDAGSGSGSHENSSAWPTETQMEQTPPSRVENQLAELEADRDLAVKALNHLLSQNIINL